MPHAPHHLAPLLLVAAGAACGDAPSLRAEPLHVAVAANFAATQERLAARFTAAGGAAVVATLGSTGQLYAQIRSGAPFHLLLAADAERPARLESEGLGVRGTRFTYAEGRLALFAPGLDSVRAGGADLLALGQARIAVANPDAAPYGAAAIATMNALGVLDAARPRIVRGESVSQAEQFVRSGAVELSFLALSQVIREDASSYWVVPSALHPPIEQDAVLLRPGETHPHARAYLDFLRSAEARAIIEADGYAAPAGLADAAAPPAGRPSATARPR